MLNILVLLYKKTGQSRSLLFIIHKIKHELFFPSQWSKKAATSADCRCIINFPTIGTHARRALRTRLSTGLVIKLKVFEKPHNFSWAIIQYQYRGRTCAPAGTEPRSRYRSRRRRSRHARTQDIHSLTCSSRDMRGEGEPTRTLPIFAPSPLPPAQILRSAYTLGKRIHSTNQYPLKSGLDNHALLNPRVFLSLYSVVSFLFFFFLSNSRNHCTHTTFHDSGWHCKKHNLTRGPQYL